MSSMFSECSIFTFGDHMGVYPRRTELTLATNETVLVHLIGSKLFFPGAQSFFQLVGSLVRNTTCPGPLDDAARRIRNVSALCAVADPRDCSLVGGLRLGKQRHQQQGEEKEGEPLCVIYDVSGRARSGGGGDVGAAPEGRAAGGLYGPGEWHFNFSGFNTESFRYAFWSVEFLTLAEGQDRSAAGGGAAVLRANVTSKGSFVNDPPAVKNLLVNAFFIGALVVCALFFVSGSEPETTCLPVLLLLAVGLALLLVWRTLHATLFCTHSSHC